MGMGVWAIVEGQAGTAISIVASVTLGIVVDDTIHFLFEYSKNQKSSSRPQAIKKTLHNVGPSLLLTTLILIMGFGIFIYSRFVPNSHFGLLCSCVLFVALAVDIVVLPSFLLLDTKTFFQPHLLIEHIRSYKLYSHEIKK